MFKTPNTIVGIDTLSTTKKTQSHELKNIFASLPIRGAAAMYWKCDCSDSWALLSCWSPSRSFSKASWGTLHPHPFRSANLVSRKLASSSWAAGSNGLRNGIPSGFSIVSRPYPWKSKQSGVAVILMQNLI